MNYFNEKRKSRTQFVKAFAEQEAITFIIRRALWFGSVKRSDISEALFPDGPTDNRPAAPIAYLSKTMSLTIKQYPNLIARGGNGRGVERVCSDPAEFPAAAAPQKMLELMQTTNQENIFRVTGLRTHEIPIITKAGITNAAENIYLFQIVQAILNKDRVDIKYVTMTPGQNSRWRTVVPISLIWREHAGWRMIASDISGMPGKDDWPTKTYTLTRLFGLRPPTRPLPRKYIRPAPNTRNFPRKYYAVLNSQLTEDQKQVVRREARLDENDEISLTDDDKIEFMDRFVVHTSAINPNNSLWPLIKSLENPSKDK